MTSLYLDTDIKLYFGGSKQAADIKRGDILMSTTSQPLVVLGIESKHDVMYELRPILPNNNSFILGESHIIELYNTSTDRVIEISIADFLLKDVEWKKNYQLMQSTLNYPFADIKNDPYLIGLIVGSNNMRLEDIIKQYLLNKLDHLSKFVNETNDLKMLNLSDINDKELNNLLETRHIADEYLYNSRDNRMRLLQGILSAQNMNSGRGRSKSIVVNKQRSRSLDKKIETESVSSNDSYGKKPKSKVKPEAKKTVARSRTPSHSRAFTSYAHFKKPKPVESKSNMQFNQHSNQYSNQYSNQNSNQRSKSPKQSLNLTQPIPVVKPKSLIPVLKKENQTIRINAANMQIIELISSLGYTYLADDTCITLYERNEGNKTLKFKIELYDADDRGVSLILNAKGHLLTNTCINV
jgi:hypothetical protein